MNKRLLSGFLILMAVIAIAFAGCTGATGATDEKIPSAEENTVISEKMVYKVGIDVPYPPFSMIDTTGKATGFDVESIEWIAEDQDLRSSSNRLHGTALSPHSQQEPSI